MQPCWTSQDAPGYTSTQHLVSADIAGAKLREKWPRSLIYEIWDIEPRVKALPLAPGVSKPVFNAPDKTGKKQTGAQASLGNPSTLVGMSHLLNVLPLQLRLLQ
jgi:hypothetical protein